MTALTKLIKIILSVEKKGTGAKDAEKELTGVQKATKLAGKALIGFATIQTARAAYELAELGAQSIRTRNAFIAISGGAEEAERRLDAMRTATRGALSEQQMMASANRLMQMGLANNAEELGNLTHMATRLGAAMGKKAGPAIEEFALMLANQSIPRLDTFGISAGRTRVRILELMKANEGMTRETAFMTAVVEEGDLAMERLGEETEDAALSFERVTAKSEDLKIALAERLTPAFSWLLDKLVLGVDEIDRIGERFDQLGGIISITFMQALGMSNDEINTFIETNLPGVLDDTAEAAESAQGPVGDAAESLIIMGLGGGQAAEGVAAAGSAAGEAEGLFGGLLDKVTTLGGKFASFDVGLDKSWDLLMKTGRATGMSVEEMGKLATSVGIADESQVRATIAQLGLVEAWDAGIISGDGVVIMTGKLDEANSELALAADAAEDGQTRLADAHTANADALIGEIEYALDYFKAQEEVTGEVEKAHGPMQALEGNIRGVAGGYEAAADGVDAFVEALMRLSDLGAISPSSTPPNLPEGAGLSPSSSFGGGPSRSYTDGRSYGGSSITVNVQDPLAAALVMEQISGELADEIAIGM